MVSISATSHKKFCHPKEVDIVMDTKKNKRVKKVQMSHDMKETALLSDNSSGEQPHGHAAWKEREDG